MCLRQCRSHYSISGKLEKTFSGSGKTDESAKKELEKLSKAMTDKIDKVTLSIRQDIKKFCLQVSETTKNLTEKLNGQEKSVTEKISGCQKTLTDKISAQEKSVKDVTDKIGENAMKRNHYKSACASSVENFIQTPICCSEKLDSSSKADSSSSSKLVTLTKAIDSIQENSKSLESMGRLK